MTCDLSSETLPVILLLKGKTKVNKTTHNSDHS